MMIPGVYHAWRESAGSIVRAPLKQPLLFFLTSAVSFLFTAYPFRLKTSRSLCRTLRRQWRVTCGPLFMKTKSSHLYCKGGNE
jgi:hypothetical protein